MNYYIQGNKEKADKIKAAFEKKGFVQEDHSDIYENNVLFFTVDGDKNVHYCWLDEPYFNIVKTHPDYQELELLIEPKFKVGDFIVDNYCKGKVIGLTNDAYLLDTEQGIPFSCENNIHLWTIQDAKDGDVLTAHGVIVLFKEIDGLNIRTHYSYHYMNTPMGFINGLHNKDVFRPATKDEREILFAKIKEEGYEWDVDKKELRKIGDWTIKDAKDGDILATDNGWTCIFQAFDGCGFSSYCFMDSQRWFCESGSEVHTPDSRINGKIHLATKEQREIFFHKMKEAGYEWDVDNKELRKIQPHYDISNFYAGMPVLVRDYIYEEWRYVQFSHMRKLTHALAFNAGCQNWYQCIPFNEETKHLLGTTNMCPEEYINW